MIKMKHIKEYEEEEIKGLIGDLEKIGQGPLKGWILAVFPFESEDQLVAGFKGTRYYAVTAHTLQEALFFVVEANIDLEKEELEELISGIESFSDIEDIINSASDYDSGFGYLQEWKGLVPKSKEPKLEIIEDPNPFVVIKKLNQEFVNVQAVMSSNL